MLSVPVPDADPRLFLWCPRGSLAVPLALSEKCDAADSDEHYRVMGLRRCSNGDLRLSERKGPPVGDVFIEWKEDAGNRASAADPNFTAVVSKDLLVDTVNVPKGLNALVDMLQRAGVPEARALGNSNDNETTVEDLAKTIARVLVFDGVDEGSHGSDDEVSHQAQRAYDLRRALVESHSAFVAEVGGKPVWLNSSELKGLASLLNLVDEKRYGCVIYGYDLDGWVLP